MYIIHITLHADRLPAGQADSLMAAHRAWFTRHFKAGSFLLLGPCCGQPNAGLIVAHAPSRDTLDRILAEDVYHADGLADYSVCEFKASMVSPRLADLQGL